VERQRTGQEATARCPAFRRVVTRRATTSVSTIATSATATANAMCNAVDPGAAADAGAAGGGLATTVGDGATKGSGNIRAEATGPLTTSSTAANAAVVATFSKARIIVISIAPFVSCHVLTRSRVHRAAARSRPPFDVARMSTSGERAYGRYKTTAQETSRGQVRRQ
jgi:hypothetical protein